MNPDSKRLLSTTGEQHEIERALLRSLRDVTAPPDAKAETWTRLQAQLAATAVVAAGAVAVESAGSAMAGSSIKAGVMKTGVAAIPAAIKLGLGLLVAGSITLGAVALWPRGTPAITPRVIVAAPSAPAPVVVPSRPDPAAAPAVQANSRPAHAKRPAAAAIPDPLGVEAAMITQARAQLKRGDARAALSTLSRLRSRSRNGALAQEREILTIQALSALGDTRSARRRARAFVANYPDSPHAAQVRGVALGP